MTVYGPRLYFGPIPDNEEETMSTTQTTLSDLTWVEHRAALRLWEFSRILRAAGLLDDDQVGYFFEKPWKWEREHAVWQSHGCPDLDGDADRFDAFAEAAQQGVEE